MRSQEFLVPINRDIPTVTDTEWEVPSAAAHRLGISMGRLRLLANGDTVRVVLNSERQQGLLRRSVDHEAERRSSAAPIFRVRFWVGDLFWLHGPDKWRSRPWDD